MRLITIASIALLASTTARAQIVFVDASAGPGGDGSSWSTAFVDLKDGIAKAKLDPSITQIWVAEGTYRPTLSGDRTARFEMLPGVSFYGGFEGTETSLAQRDPAA